MGKLIGNREAWHSFPAGLGLESNWGAALLVLLPCRGEGWGAWSPRPGLLGAFPPPGTLTLSRNRKFLNYTSTVQSIPPPSERVPPPPLIHSSSPVCPLSWRRRACLRAGSPAQGASHERHMGNVY